MFKLRRLFFFIVLFLEYESECAISRGVGILGREWAGWGGAGDKVRKIVISN